MEVFRNWAITHTRYSRPYHRRLTFEHLMYCASNHIFWLQNPQTKAPSPPSLLLLFLFRDILLSLPQILGVLLPHVSLHLLLCGKILSQLILLHGEKPSNQILLNFTCGKIFSTLSTVPHDVYLWYTLWRPPWLLLHLLKLTKCLLIYSRNKDCIKKTIRINSNMNSLTLPRTHIS